MQFNYYITKPHINKLKSDIEKFNLDNPDFKLRYVVEDNTMTVTESENKAQHIVKFNEDGTFKMLIPWHSIKTLKDN
jgi:hypothetical protein